MTTRIYSPMALCFMLLCCGSVQAADKVVAQQVASEIEPFVNTLVKQTSDYLTTAKSFSLRSDITTDEVLPSGEKIQLSRRAQVVVRRPDRLRAEVNSDIGATRFYYDGKKLSRFDMDNNVYGSIKVPGTIEAALDHAMENYGVDATTVPDNSEKG